MSVSRKVLRRMKKVMGLIGTSAVLVPCSSQVSCAEDKKWVHSKRDNVVEYILDDDGVLKISCLSGKGRITYNWQNQPGFYKNKVLNVVIENNIKEIGFRAFANCNNIKSIRIPESVTRIFGYAFYYGGFETIEIPNSISEIGKGAFAECAKLKTFKVYNASLGMTNLDEDTGIKLVNHINVFQNAFGNCTSLKELCFCNCCVVFAQGAFNRCNKELINLEGKTIHNLTYCSSSNLISNSNFPISIGDDGYSFNDGVNGSFIGKKRKE